LFFRLHPYFFYSYQLKCHLSYLCCDAFIYLFIYSVSGGNIFISGASDLWSIEVQNIFLLEVYWILLRVISARANQYAVLSLCLNNFLTSFKVWMHWTFHSLVTQLWPWYQLAKMKLLRSCSKTIHQQRYWHELLEL